MTNAANLDRHPASRVGNPSIKSADVTSNQTAESRFNPITGQWTILAPDRSMRPEEIVSESESTDESVTCPFCVGHESETPEEIWVGQIDEPGLLDESTNDSNWSVRVVSNKFPAVNSLGTPDTSVGGLHDDRLFARSPINGGHEVFIESRRHVQSVSELDVAEVELLFRAYQARIRHWRSIPEVQYISLFKNVGGKAGASLRHSHSQLIALNQMPSATQTMLNHMTRHRLNSGCCLQCDLIRGEEKANERIVWKDDSLIAFCPFASHLPMMLRVTTQEHCGCFSDLKAPTIESLARFIRRAVSWLEQIRPETSYNYVLRTSPPGFEDISDSFHWCLDLFPRMTETAGFEWNSGCMINPVLPEAAASMYRKCARREDPRGR